MPISYRQACIVALLHTEFISQLASRQANKEKKREILKKIPADYLGFRTAPLREHCTGKVVSYDLRSFDEPQRVERQRVFANTKQMSSFFRLATVGMVELGPGAPAQCFWSRARSQFPKRACAWTVERLFSTNS